VHAAFGRWQLCRGPAPAILPVCRRHHKWSQAAPKATRRPSIAAISKTIQRRLVDTWRQAGKAMETECRRALVSRTPDDCRDEALDMLALGSVASARRQEQR
jgi:hypothetical protein